MSHLLPQPHRRPVPKRIDSVLLVRRNGLGDAVAVLPVLSALRRDHPRVRLGVCATTYNAPVFARSRLVDELYVIPNRGNKLLLRWHSDVRRMRAARYDVAASASATFSSFTALLLVYAGSRYRVGPANAAGSLYDRLYDHADRTVVADQHHQVLRVAGMLHRAGVLSAAEFERLLSGPARPASGQEEDTLLEVTASRREYITLCPDGTWQEHGWPLANWQALARGLRRRLSQWPVRLILARPSGAHAVLEQHGEVSVLPTPNIDALAGALGRSELVVCAEGGTAHLAAALGAAVISLSNKKIAAGWRPWSLRALMLEAPGAIGEISPDEVLVQLERWLSHRSWLITPHASSWQSPADSQI